MARWPGKIESGVTISEPMWSPDLMIACAELADAPLPRGVTLDGKNLLTVLAQGAPSPHQSLFFEYKSHAALRKGDWKIVREKQDVPWKLFKLKTDLDESKDLARKNSGKLQELAVEFANWKASLP